MKNIKISVSVPLTHADVVRKVIGDSGAGIIGNYSHCTFSSKGIGTFKPNKDANPSIGEANKIENVEEEKIEFICQENIAKKTIEEIRKVHPYEEIVLEIYPLISEEELT